MKSVHVAMLMTKWMLLLFTGKCSTLGDFVDSLRILANTWFRVDNIDFYSLEGHQV